LCIGTLIDPRVIATRHTHVAVETVSPLTIGRSVIDLRQHIDQPANCHVALSADRRMFVELLIDTLSRH
jgi:purine nucleosidase/ribosylpyrimidine nucleosidase